VCLSMIMAYYGLLRHWSGGGGFAQFHVVWCPFMNPCGAWERHVVKILDVCDILIKIILVLTYMVGKLRVSKLGI
jgi:hypothetical protein